ncbi:MAG TPA: adenosylcobinamide-GDP ribazoletransferase, partial [Sphaerochaetaceae bacterium]|nr:adenosylcobinamide-GDP ribazoletransferase [Sphaerochaetaceae bacterium]
MKGWGLASAFRTLTILSVPGNECECPATTLYWFVPVGAVIGALLSGIGWLGAHHELFQLTAVFIVIALAVITRAFHLDGLADTFDGFGGGWTKERRLEIMRDST